MSFSEVYALILYVLVVVPSSAVTIIFIIFSPSFKLEFPTISILLFSFSGFAKIFNFFVSCGILKLKDEVDIYVFRLNGFFEYFLAY